MGNLWSKKGNQFEKELEKLDKSITYTEYRQRTAHTNKRRFVSYLIYIAVLSELILICWFYFHKKPTQILDKVIDCSPLVLPPFAGYIFSKAVSFYYTRRIKSDEAKLAKLRTQLKQRLEERKKATEFDTTQQLLSKYERLTKDGPASPKGGAAPPQPFAGGKKGQAQPQQQIRQRPNSPTATTSPPPPFASPSPSPATRPAAPPGAPAAHPLPPPCPPPLPTHRSWLDKLVDYVVGGEPQHSFALICSNCKAHNGLIPQSEMQSFQFRCRFCNHFNEAPSTPPSAATPSPSSSSSSSSTNQKSTSPSKSKKNE